MKIGPADISFFQMRDIHHDNINQFIGAAIESDRTYIVTQYALRGSLKVRLNDVKLAINYHFHDMLCRYVDIS